MAKYKTTVEGGDTMVVYTTDPPDTSTFLDDLKVLKAYALEVAKIMGMGNSPTITIEEIGYEVS